MARVATLAGFVVVTFTWTSAVQMSMPAVAQESQPTEATAPLPRLCQNLQPVHTLKGHLGPVSDIEISSDNTKVITSSADGSVKVWDIETGQLEKSFFDVISYYWSPPSLKGSNNPEFTFVGSHSHGDRGGGNRFEVAKLNIQTGEVVSKIISNSVNDPKWSIHPDGDLMFIYHWQGARENGGVKIDIWDFETNQIIKTIPSGLKHGTEIEFHPDGRHLIVNGKRESMFSSSSYDRPMDDAAELWDLETGDLVRTFERSSITMSPDQKDLLIWDEQAEQVLEWNLSVGSSTVSSSNDFDRQNQASEFSKSEFEDFYNSFFGLRGSIHHIHSEVAAQRVEQAIKLSSTTDQSITCLLPIKTDGRSHNLSDLIKTIPDKELMITASGNFIDIMKLSETCTPDNNQELSNKIERLERVGYRQLDEDLFEAAEITFWELFSAAHQTCDEIKQAEALFFIGESRFRNPFSLRSEESKTWLYGLTLPVFRRNNYELLFRASLVD